MDFSLSLLVSFSKYSSLENLSTAIQPIASVKPAAVAVLIALPTPGIQPTSTWDIPLPINDADAPNSVKI